ncbi:FkbM family methyltransferase [Marinobacter nauticus]|uniref:FkbM family methyltransferase n=1 Tax=Marinobacter nauticus TaxID=2743 RepID=UPI001C991E60|nr:FkbM family methyltransferase [Marinobacter nauticus]MBY5961902.1 FkbM family methyltransferase [Marinobacter nauticus]
MLRMLAGRLPEFARVELKRINYRNQISKGRFRSPEIEFNQLHELIKPGDWVIDVGANVGHYTRRFSELVGDGRVLAFEPHPRTFAFLASNVADLGNVTLFNSALSDAFAEVGFTVPAGNFYQATITSNGESRVATLHPSVIGFQNRIAFIKIDAEGHEKPIIGALEDLIEKHRPILMVENHREFLAEWAVRHRYQFDDFEGSHNHILKPA